MKRIRMAGLAVAALCALSLIVFALDTDMDNMTDEYEDMYGLDKTNAADAGLDYDLDLLTNVQEAAIWTDPFSADTDWDGWTDAEDDVPISRAVQYWGLNQFTSNHTYSYPVPDWFAGGYKLGGDWLTNGWQATVSTGTSIRSLNLEVYNDVLTNNLVISLQLFDLTNASVFLQILDSNETVLADYEQDNLAQGTMQEATRIRALPFNDYPEASIARICVKTGEVHVYRSMLYVDDDMDGLDRQQEAQAGTSDAAADTDADGLSDWEECFVTMTDPANQDSDGDGIDDGDEINVYGTNPLDADTDADGIPDFWEIQNGLNPTNGMDCMNDDDHDGFGAVYEYIHGTDGTNAASCPTATVVVTAGGTIQDAINQAEAFDIIFIQPGTYSGVGNYNLKYSNKPLMIMSDFGTVILNGGFRHFDLLNGGVDYRSVISGLILQNANSVSLYLKGSSPTIRDCLVRSNGVTGTSNGSGLYVRDASPLLVNCVFMNNRSVKGGAVYALNAEPTFRNCTILDNEATELGKAVCVVGSTPARMVNCIVWDHVTNEIEQLAGLTDIAYSDIIGGCAGEGNLTNDPLFVSNTYRFALNSPCVNSGSSTNAPWADIEGHARTNGVDLGAWEYGAEYTDSDDDGYWDAEEAGISDPLDPLSVPVSMVSVSGQVYYEGAYTGRIHVVAVTNEAGWSLDYSAALTNPGPYSLDIPVLTNIWIKAWRDVNGNQICDEWEPMAAHESSPLFLTHPTQDVDLYIENADRQISTVSGAAFSNAFGIWEVQGDTAQMTASNGWVDYAIYLPEAGDYALDVFVTVQHLFSYQSSDMTAFMDGRNLGRAALERQDEPVEQRVRFLLPYLEAGTHTARVEWINYTRNSSYTISRIEIVEPAGPDDDENGMPDWLDERMAISGVATSTMQSHQSPVCLEGTALYKDALSLWAAGPGGTNATSLAIMDGPDDLWYTDVPLCSTSATELTLYDAMWSRAWTGAIEWAPWNVYDVNLNQMTIRTEDTIRFQAWDGISPSSTSLFVIVGVTNYVLTGSQTVDHTFDSPNTHSIEISEGIDFGQGYDYIAIQIFTESVDPSQGRFQAIDNMTIDNFSGVNPVLDPGFTNGLFEVGGWAFSDQDADIGWIIPATNNTRWNFDASNNYVFADNDGIPTMGQIIYDQKQTKGRQRVFLDIVNNNTAGKIRVCIWGVDGPFRINLWDTQGPRMIGESTLIGTQLTHDDSPGSKVYPWSRWTFYDQILTSVTVRTVSGGFNEDPVCWVGKTREWECIGVPTNAVIEAGENVNLSFLSYIHAGGRTYELTAQTPSESHMVMRTEPGGSILDSATIHVLEFASGASVSLKRVDENEYGDVTYEMVIYAYPPPADDTFIEMTAVTQGLTFEAGGETVLRLYGSDFDDHGFCAVRIIKAAGAPELMCTRFHVYQVVDGEEVLVGVRFK